MRFHVKGVDNPGLVASTTHCVSVPVPFAKTVFVSVASEGGNCWISIACKMRAMWKGAQKTQDVLAHEFLSRVEVLLEDRCSKKANFRQPAVHVTFS